MVKSMTGFAYVIKPFDSYEIEVRAKSLNQKGLEISIKGVKDILFFIEKDIRNLISNYIERGYIQIFLNIKYTEPKVLLNLDNLKQAVDKINILMSELKLQLSADKIYDLAISTASEMEDNKLDEQVKKNLLETVEIAVKDLVNERIKEGEKLVNAIQTYLDQIEGLLILIEKEKENIIEENKRRLVEKIKELLGEDYSERAFIEASLLAEKLDITEEIVRLKSHIKRFRELLNNGNGSIGRKLDFLCQEMHREINTLGNKMPDFSKYTVEIKTLIDKIRQQVQNIE
ncbi:MAG: YicC family protein [Persephonella sp.]|nr:MAG: YicC family protein [Persephonella sp.]RUM59910.1 MAG: YicC family protein [Persephonella sp.]